MNTHQDRRLHWESCHNARDIGGYPTRDGRRIRPGLLVRSDHLTRLTETGRQCLLDYGITMIIDLRRPHEVEELPNPFEDAGTPAVFHHSLINPDDNTGNRFIRSQADLTPVYRFVIDAYPDRLAAVLKVIANADGAVLVQCHAGKDRTGMIVALVLALCGVENELIEEDFALSFQYLREIYLQSLEGLKDDPEEYERMSKSVGHRPGRILPILEYLDEKFGGAEAYLLSAGVTPDEINRIRERFIE